jgi:hypothetical protein
VLNPSQIRYASVYLDHTSCGFIAATILKFLYWSLPVQQQRACVSLFISDCSTVVSDRYTSDHFSFPNLTRFTSTLSAIGFVLVTTHGKITLEGRSLILTRDIVGLPFRRPFLRVHVVIRFLRSLCFMSPAQRGLERRHLGQSSRCHINASVKRPPWDRCYSGWRPLVRVELRRVNIIPRNAQFAEYSP